MSSLDPSASVLLAHYLRRIDEGEELEFDAFCAAHPTKAKELQALFLTWRKVAPFVGADGTNASLAQRLEVAFGPEVPELGSLDEEGLPGDDFTKGLWSRLETRDGTLGRYRVKSKVGEGGQGSVLQVWDEDLRRHLAMKVLVDKSQSKSDAEARPTPRVIGRFLEEPQVTGQLDHPGIVPVHELGLDSKGRLFFTMKLVKGDDLSVVFQRVRDRVGGWSLSRAVDALLRVCDAVSYAHSKGVVHRDLKPLNVMVGRFGEVYVMDWGLARVLGRDMGDQEPNKSDSQASVEIISERREKAAETPDSPMLTMEGDVVGTPSYMSPEQAGGRLEDVDQQSDVYSIGAMLYELLSGQSPYVPQGAKLSARTVLVAVLQGPPTPIRELTNGVPQELEAICERAMARDRRERYESAQELAEDLRAFLDGRVVRAYQTGGVAEFRKWVERNKGMAGALALSLLIVVVSVLGFFGMQSNKAAAMSEANDVLKVERDEKQFMADVLLARFLNQTLDEHVPDVTGVRKMERWLRQAEDLLERAEMYRPGSQQLWFGDQFLAEEEQAEFLADLAGVQRDMPSVVSRLREVRALESRSILEHENAWHEAISAILSSDVYDIETLDPQLGLVPLRENSAGLWEFWHVLSGEEPVFDKSSGKWQLEPETGMILVLIPGGDFEMGSPEGQQDKQVDETLHRVELQPFFLSAFETTRAQWLRVRDFDPSFYELGKRAGGKLATVMGPVESVTWNESAIFARLLDLRLGTEEEWEYACRAASPERFHCGPFEDCLEGMENLGDQTFMEFDSGDTGENLRSQAGLGKPAPWSDGHAVTAPVGSFEANEFGLYDMLGNVGEWTSSLYRRNYLSESIGVGGSDLRVARGGNHIFGPSFARCASRQPLPAGNSSRLIGVRLARDLR